MPRQARIDAPGALHHIIVRGIEQQAIFRDDHDRNDYLSRIGKILLETSTACYAWSLMTNHTHFLISTGSVPVATVMRRLLTGYAVSFNHRYLRHGQLFQNRYKSILCEEDAYLLELTRYIHLNPLRAGAVKDLKSLDIYPFSGHAVLMGNQSVEWQTTEPILQMFHSGKLAARSKYRDFMMEGIAAG
ncbi:MAG: transposase, partial [Eubacteriales bacterium]|nr:transposase [Eubacteriales bacterium]